MWFMLKRAALAVLDFLYGVADGAATWLDAKVLHEAGPVARLEARARRALAPRVHRSVSLDGNAIAERVANTIGSWRFIGMQAALMTLWVLWNTLAPRGRFDNYPFVFLNLAMSAEAAFTGPILLIAAVVAAIRDHKQADRVEQLTTQGTAQAAQLEALTAQMAQMVTGIAALLQADHVEHGRVLAMLAARTGDDSEDGNLLSTILERVTTLQEQLSAKATVRAAKKAATGAA